MRRLAALAWVGGALHFPPARRAWRPVRASGGPAKTVEGEAPLTPEDLAARDPDGPPSEYDWDAHLGRLEDDAAAVAEAAAEAERAALAGGDEWVPAEGELDRLASPPLVDDEPAFLKPRWDEVDPALHDYRNPPPSRGSTWSNIRVKSAWPQFEDGERLRTEGGWIRFDQRAFNVTANLFEPATDFAYGRLDLDVVAAIAPAISQLGAVARLLEAADGVVRLKYDGPAKHRVGMEAYATMLVRAAYPALESLTFEATQVSDYLDGGRETWEGMCPEPLYKNPLISDP